MHSTMPLAARLVWASDALMIVLPPRWYVHRNARRVVLGTAAVATLLLSWSVLAAVYGGPFASVVVPGGLGLVVAGYTLAQATRRGAVTVGDQTVTLDESGIRGVWRFRRHVRTFQQIRGLRLYVGQSDAEGFHPAVLEVVCQGIQSAWFGAGYPDEVLRWVAGELAARLQVGCDETGGLAKLPVGFHLAEGTEEAIQDEDTCDVEEPAGLKVRREADSGPSKRLVLHIPPSGVEGPAFAVSAACCLLLMIATGITLTWAVARSRAAPPVLLVPLVPAVAAILAFLAANRVCRLRARIELTDEGMKLYRETLFGDEEYRDLERTELRAVRTCVTQGKTKYTALRIETTDGATDDYFAGRPADELRWLATVIRQRLGTPAVAPVKVELDAKRG